MQQIAIYWLSVVSQHVSEIFTSISGDPTAFHCL